MGEMIDVSYVAAAVERYARAAGCAVMARVDVWDLYVDRSVSPVYVLYVEKTRTHYRFKSMPALLDALRIKTMLLESP